MSGNGEDFRVRPGRIRSTRAGKSKSFVNQVLRAAKKAGHTAPQSGAGKRDRPWPLDFRARPARVQPQPPVRDHAAASW